MIDPPALFQFPNLKILGVFSLAYKSDSLFRFLSICPPVLEDLSFESHYSGCFQSKAITLGVFNHKTSVATLKRLRITFECFKYDNFDDKIEINAPSLEYFRFDGHFFFLQKLDNLVEADVNIRKFEVGVSVLI